MISDFVYTPRTGSKIFSKNLHRSQRMALLTWQNGSHHVMGYFAKVELYSAISRHYYRHALRNFIQAQGHLTHVAVDRRGVINIYVPWDETERLVNLLQRFFMQIRYSSEMQNVYDQLAIQGLGMIDNKQQFCATHPNHPFRDRPDIVIIDYSFDWLPRTPDNWRVKLVDGGAWLRYALRMDGIAAQIRRLNLQKQTIYGDWMIWFSRPESESEDKLAEAAEELDLQVVKRAIGEQGYFVSKEFKKLDCTVGRGVIAPLAHASLIELLAWRDVHVYWEPRGGWDKYDWRAEFVLPYKPDAKQGAVVEE